MTANEMPVALKSSSRLSLKEVIRRGDPVLREQRRQLFLGIGVSMVVFVLLYPALLESGERGVPKFLLVCGLILPIVNNVLGYRFIGRPFMGISVRENYEQERRNIKIFTILTAILRGLSAGLLIGCLFFSYKLDDVRLWVLRGVILFYVADLGFIIRLWIIRFGRLLSNLDYFHSLIYPDDEEL